jgi:UDP-N-acetylmuramyl pentapeptide phosphotransferase/UDP-N-acetylglucosamine-1-phosphate transferase
MALLSFYPRSSASICGLILLSITVVLYVKPRKGKNPLTYERFECTVHALLAILALVLFGFLPLNFEPLGSKILKQFATPVTTAA